MEVVSQFLIDTGVPCHTERFLGDLEACEFFRKLYGVCQRDSAELLCQTKLDFRRRHILYKIKSCVVFFLILFQGFVDTEDDIRLTTQDNGFSKSAFMCLIGDYRNRHYAVLEAVAYDRFNGFQLGTHSLNHGNLASCEHINCGRLIQSVVIGSPVLGEIFHQLKACFQVLICKVDLSFVHSLADLSELYITVSGYIQLIHDSRVHLATYGVVEPQPGQVADGCIRESKGSDICIFQFLAHIHEVSPGLRNLCSYLIQHGLIIENTNNSGSGGITGNIVCREIHSLTDVIRQGIFPCFSGIISAFLIIKIFKVAQISTLVIG